MSVYNWAGAARIIRVKYLNESDLLSNLAWLQVRVQRVLQKLAHRSWPAYCNDEAKWPSQWNRLELMSRMISWITLLQGVRASVRPDEAQRKVKEWQDNFKAYQTALQRLSAAPSMSAAAPSPVSVVPANSVALSAESAAAEVPLSSSKDVSGIAAHSSTWRCVKIFRGTLCKSGGFIIFISRSCLKHRLACFIVALAPHLFPSDVAIIVPMRYVSESSVRCDLGIACKVKFHDHIFNLHLAIFYYPEDQRSHVVSSVQFRSGKVGMRITDRNRSHEINRKWVEFCDDPREWMSVDGGTSLRRAEGSKRTETWKILHMTVAMIWFHVVNFRAIFHISQKWLVTRWIWMQFVALFPKMLFLNFIHLLPTSGGWVENIGSKPFSACASSLAYNLDCRVLARCSHKI